MMPRPHRAASPALATLLAMAFAWGPETAEASPAPARNTICRGSEGHAAGFDGRRTFTLRPDALAAIRARLPDAPVIGDAYRSLLARADIALARKPVSVIDKRSVAVSGDRHDYVSLARYWWPDPADPKGKYVRRDGQTNPEIETDRFDRAALGRMARDTDTLALAYYYSGERKYAEGAAAAIRAWFLDPATAMNPNMDYAQAVPGVAEGRPEGVLDGAGFIAVIDAAGLIAPSGALAPAETVSLERWFGRYLDWMLESANGRAEGKAQNNHGLWYDAQVARFALFARRPDIARDIVAAFPARLGRQVDDKGTLPAELKRTRSFHYSLYALEAAYMLADSAACLGIDLYGTEEQPLRRATDHVAAYRGRAGDWPYREMNWPAGKLDELLIRADMAWGPGVWPRSASGDLLLRYRVP